MAKTEGQCRCGAVRFEISADPLMTMACHCTGCQRRTGSAFSLSSLFPVAGFEVVAGTPVEGGLRGATKHMFCPDCMSWLFTRPEGLDDFVNVRSTLLDDARTYQPFIETWTDEKLPWAATGAAHSYATVPEDDAFPGLLGAFSEQQGASGDLTDA